MQLLLPPSRSVLDGGTAVSGADAPPLEYYTGTLYKAIDAGSLTPAQRRWAAEHLAIHTLDGGLVHADRWEPLQPLAAILAAGETILDLRSGEYARKVKLPAGGWSVRVVSEGDDGRRLAVSHWNKLYKGQLVGALVRERPRVSTVPGLVRWANRAGFRLEQVGDRQLEFVV